jgi:hypothetical protein
MNTRTSKVLALAMCAWTLATAQLASAAEDFKGSWTITPSTEAGKVQFGLMHRHNGGNLHHESDWPQSAFQGLDLSVRGKRDVNFSIDRDAGRFTCEGYVNNGDGAGIFRFAPDSKYAGAMDALGFTGVDDEKQFAMAVHDVTLDFAKAIKAERLTDMDTDKLIAFGIFDVTPQFIREMRAEGLPATDSDKLVAFRIHGVTPAMVRDVRRSGLSPTEDQFVAMRIHGVTPEFIDKVEGLGFKNPGLDQLVAMRIHGVTPEFINDMKSRGLKNLTIDQLVNLRIHGID